MRTGWIVSICALAVLIFVISQFPGIVAQDTEKETVTLEVDEYYGFETTELDKDIELTFEFRTDDNVMIDVYIFDETNFNRYENGLPSTAEKSVENSASGKAKYRTDEEGVYYIVFDNTDYGPADPEGPVTVRLEVTVDEDDKGPDTMVICGILVVGAIIVIFIRVKMKKKKRAKEELAEAAAQIQSDPAFAIGTAAQAKREPPVDRTDVKICHSCGKPAAYIEKYKRHYCYDCKEYTEIESSEAAGSDIRPCPTCGNDCNYIEQYKRHYCYNCKEYLK